MDFMRILTDKAKPAWICKKEKNVESFVVLILLNDYLHWNQYVFEFNDFLHWNEYVIELLCVETYTVKITRRDHFRDKPLDRLARQAFDEF